MTLKPLPGERFKIGSWLENEQGDFMFASVSVTHQDGCESKSCMAHISNATEHAKKGTLAVTTAVDRALNEAVVWQRARHYIKHHLGAA